MTISIKRWKIPLEAVQQTSAGVGRILNTSETENQTRNEHGKKRECAQNVFIFPLMSSLHKEIQKERTTHIR